MYVTESSVLGAVRVLHVFRHFMIIIVIIIIIIIIIVIIIMIMIIIIIGVVWGWRTTSILSFSII